MEGKKSPAQLQLLLNAPLLYLESMLETAEIHYNF